MTISQIIASIRHARAKIAEGDRRLAASLPPRRMDAAHAEACALLSRSTAALARILEDLDASTLQRIEQIVTEVR